MINGSTTGEDPRTFSLAPKRELAYRDVARTHTPPTIERTHIRMYDQASSRRKKLWENR